MEIKTEKLLKAFGILVICVGIIASIISGSVIANEQFDVYSTEAFLGISLVGIIASIICGLLLFGFGEVISFLDETTKHITSIDNKLNEKE